MTDDRVALVTGGNKGIGFETVRLLAGAGLTVLLGARDAGRGARAAAELAGAGEVRYVALDVADEESVRAAAGVVGSEYGRLDVLVNNAGTAGRVRWGGGPVVPSGTPLAALRETFETNVFGVVAVTNAVLPLLRRAPAGRIVNVSSGLGSLTLLADPPKEWPVEIVRTVPYNASKAALNAVTIMYAAELRGTGVTVNSVSPGYCATDLNDNTGFLPASAGAAIVVRAALEDDRTGAFLSGEGTIPW
jgi:NAD(P)-dependent dehydrogenase (short-subunit alcohol dehydrogenase family)